ncbi:MAG: thiamine pyrophosphate-dependent dehydrogenase E1 component subunit alpha [Acidobacteriota bacterium]|nr:thiamine pyrophosphate-dependent dehydrogenase E1 component subunit alpha [Acidobacteriota bacterium]
MLPDNKVCRDMLYYMKLSREIETRIERKLYRQGKIVGGVYVGRGQEAISVGSSIQLEQDDCICPSHRDMGAFLIRGLSARAVLAQYMGKKTGVTRGKEANMHMGDMRHKIVAFVSMLADTVPVAAGIALAYKMRRQRNVVLCYFGDGATSRGDWHEGLNLAAVQRVPVVFLCNNNQYAYSTPLEKQMPIRDISIRARGYAMPGVTVDGNDVMAVYEATREAVELARDGGGPSLIECKTFRMTGHSAHDDGRYVPKELFEEWGKKDPILRWETRLIRDKVMSERDVREMATRITQEVDQAVSLAENDPLPDPEETLEGVYADQSVDAPLAFAASFFSPDRWR